MRNAHHSDAVLAAAREHLCSVLVEFVRTWGWSAPDKAREELRRRAAQDGSSSSLDADQPIWMTPPALLDTRPATRRVPRRAEVDCAAATNARPLDQLVAPGEVTHA